MLQCYVLTCGRSVTAFLASPRSQRPGQEARSPHPKAGPASRTGRSQYPCDNLISSVGVLTNTSVLHRDTCWSSRPLKPPPTQRVSKRFEWQRAETETT
jgi:hypothetical protein